MFKFKNYYPYVEEFFIAMSSSLLVLLIIESLKAGLVSSRLNLNYWLMAWVISAILLLYMKSTTPPAN